MINKSFILAGNAIFTVVNTKTGNRFTYRVRQPSASSPHFVSVLIGPDNTNDYTFLGTIFNKARYHRGHKSSISFNATSAKCFWWLWKNIDNLPDCIEINHEGHCGRCGRLLTTPESVEAGFGPICINKGD